jgi:hypothetical protein
VKNINEILPLMTDASKAWISIWRRKYGFSAEDICKKISEKFGEDVDPVSVEHYLHSKGVLPAPAVSQGAEPVIPTANFNFPNAIERDIESALVSQLDSLGLRLFVDEKGRNGQQYPAGEFGRIDLITTDMSGDFVVIELKREDVPRATIGQIAGYIAFVRKNIAKPEGHSVVGWIMARPSSPAEDSILQESADAVGILVKWYDLKLTFLEGQSS